MSAVPYIDIGSIDRDSKRVGETKMVNATNAPTRARQWVRTGDVLVSMTRPNLNAVAMVTPNLDGSVASTGFDVLRAIGVLPDWLFYRVRTDEFIRDVCGDVQGVVYPAIRPADVRRHVLPIAPLNEQRRIVEAVESYLSRLDAVAASLEGAQVRLAAYRASVLKAAVEGRLVPTEAEVTRAQGRDYEPADILLKRILAERRRRWEEAELAGAKGARIPPRDSRWKSTYEDAVAPHTQDLPDLPEGWCWASLGQLITEPLANGKSVPDGHGFPVLRLTAIGRGIVTPSESKTGDWRGMDPSPFTIRVNDFLIVRGNGSLKLVGRGGRVVSSADPVAYPDTLIRARISVDGLVPTLIPRWWDSPIVRQHIERRARTTAGIYKVNQTDLAETPIPLPPIAEQKRIVAELERLDSVAEVITHDLNLTSERGLRLRQSILKSAFEGKLVGQDLTDEPAEKLLERIRAERASSTPAKPKRSRKAKAAR